MGFYDYHIVIDRYMHRHDSANGPIPSRIMIPLIPLYPHA